MSEAKEFHPQKLKLIILGIMASFLPGSVCFFYGSAANFSSGGSTARIAIGFVPFLLVIGAGIGFVASYLRSNPTLVITGAVYAWLPGVVAAGIMARALELSGEQGYIALGTFGVLTGIVAGLIPTWIAYALIRETAAE